MRASLTERELGGLRWIRLEGPAAEAFEALGEHSRADIGAVLSDWDGLDELRRHAAGPSSRIQRSPPSSRSVRLARMPTSLVLTGAVRLAVRLAQANARTLAG